MEDMVLLTTHYSMLRVLFRIPTVGWRIYFLLVICLFFFLRLHLVTKSYTTYLFFFHKFIYFCL